MPHLYEYITDAELHAYICGVIERTRGPLSTRAASLRRQDDAARQRTQIIRTDRRVTAKRPKT
jgi:hypothetical protein